jgi:thiol-disulfide isomerase/thioredoxin
MKVGNTAPDFVFPQDYFDPGYQDQSPEKLSDIKSQYTVIVFGASWCPACHEELSELLCFMKDGVNTM